MKESSTHLLAVCLGIFITSTSGSASAQKTPEFHLELHNGQSHYLTGVSIPLDLVVTNTTDEAIGVEQYGMPRDEFFIEPEKGWVQWKMMYSQSTFGIAEIEKGDSIRTELSSGPWVFLQPGHYLIKDKTTRIDPGMQNKPDKPVLTNSVAIDISSRSEAVEHEQIQSAMAIIHANSHATGPKKLEAYKATAQLAVLAGQEALRAKLEVILSDKTLMTGMLNLAMVTTRDLDLQLSLLQEAWSNPLQPPYPNILRALSVTRAMLRQGKLYPSDLTYSKGKSDDPERLNDLHDLMRSLPSRSGESRTVALQLLLSSPDLSAEDLAEVRAAAGQ